MSEFSYSDQERRALAESVPDPEFLDSMDDWGKMVWFPDHCAFLSDKEGFIARNLEWSARECLTESSFPKSKKENLAVVKSIDAAALKLLSDLKKPSFYRANYGIAFLGVDYGWQRFGDETLTPSHEVLVQLLTELVEAAPFVEQNYSSYHESDHFLRAHSPGFARFVSQVLTFWRGWTGAAPGSGKQGGPAARFLMAAANPVIIYSANQLGIQLRVGGKLDEAAAAQLIVSDKKQREAWIDSADKRCRSEDRLA